MHNARARLVSPCGQMIHGLSIGNRPADLADQAIPGHWQGGLITGPQNMHMSALVGRQSRFTLLVKVQGNHTTIVVTAMSTQMRQLPAALRQPLNWDRGMELARQKSLTARITVRVYFCDPQSPWQRGTDERTNRLLHQYFLKGTDLSRDSQANLNTIA